MLHLLESSWPRPRFAWIGCALTALSGCSPTYQSVYEGDVRFEHCYRVDEERQVPISDKLACWRDWTHRYRYGQSRDRIAYAHARERTLAEAMAAGQQAAPRGAAGIAPCPLPQPTSAFAPPPQTMKPASVGGDLSAASESSAAAPEGVMGDAGTRADGSSSLAAETSPSLVDAPGASCASACAKTWTTCKQQCKVGGCRSACDERYRGCMRTCF